jgi:hypothetical protein
MANDNQKRQLIQCLDTKAVAGGLLHQTNRRQCCIELLKLIAISVYHVGNNGTELPACYANKIANGSM